MRRKGHEELCALAACRVQDARARLNGELSGAVAREKRLQVHKRETWCVSCDNEQLSYIEFGIGIECVAKTEGGSGCLLQRGFKLNHIIDCRLRGCEFERESPPSNHTADSSTM